MLFTKNRSTYGNEAGSALGFMLFNDPDAIHSAADVQAAASNVGYTFNWFYTDKNDIAYFNSGDNPVRPAGADPNLPTWSQYEWQGWNPDTNRATYTPAAQHPQVVNQDYLTSWNNKQAPGFSAADDNFGYNSIHRSQSLDERIKPVIAAGRKFTRGKPVEAMEDAATVDLRVSQVLPYLLRVLRSGPVNDPVATPQPVTFCGGGSLSQCRTVLADSLLAATKVPAAATYPATADCTAGDQFRADQIVHQTMGGITQDRMAWVNRPTYQQVVEFPARRGSRSSPRAAGTVGKTLCGSGRFRPGTCGWPVPIGRPRTGTRCTNWRSTGSDDLVPGKMRA